LTGVFSGTGSAAFSKPTPGTEGNELRNQFNGPGFADTDLSLLKNFPIREWGFQIRADGFNLFNRVNLTMPAGATPASPVISDLSNASFGRATSVFNARYFQLAARFNF
jgi:hypothetical protein